MKFDRDDGRPAFLTDDGSSVALSGVTLARGSKSAYDIGFTKVAGYSVGNTVTTIPPVWASADATKGTVTQSGLVTDINGFTQGVVAFTPTAGTIEFTCGMNMLRGSIVAVQR